MTQDYHRLAEETADQADSLALVGDVAAARGLYVQAAGYEEETLAALEGLERHRTYGIVGVTAVTLYVKAEAYPQAEALSYKLLQHEHLPAFARSQLKDLLQDVWNAQQAAAQRLSVAAPVIDVALKGGEIGFGIAPLDLVVAKLDGVQKLIYRMVEYLKGFDLRVTSPPVSEITTYCRASISEARPGSYRFSVKLWQPQQLALFPSEQVALTEIADGIMGVLSSVSIGDSGELRDIVHHDQYREVMVKLVRNIVPDGIKVKEIEFNQMNSQRHGLVSLNDRTKEYAARVLREMRLSDTNVILHDQPLVPPEMPISRYGRLRGLHLDQKWLDIREDDGNMLKCDIEDAVVVDDVVGPMVDKQVEVIGVWRGQHRNRRFVLLDIDRVDGT